MRSLSVFRFAFNTVKKRYSFLTITALVLVAGVFLYYFYFLTARADTLDQRQYRVLSRIDKRLAERIDVYKSIASARAFGAGYLLKYALEETDSASAGRILSSPRALREEFNEALREIASVYDVTDDLSMKNLTITPAEPDDPDESAIELVNRDSSADLSIHVHQSIELPNETVVAWADIDFAFDLGVLMDPILRRDLFDGYLIVKGDHILYESTPSGNTVFKVDSSNAEDLTQTGSAFVPTTTINGQEFRVYEVKYTKQADLGWRIIGIKSTDSFLSEKRVVPRTYLFIVFLLILFLVLAVPFIKSMIMNRAERLDTSDVIFSAISLAVATSVVSILLLDGYLRNELDDAEQEKQLVELSQTVNSNLVNETNAAIRELENYATFIAADSQLEKACDYPDSEVARNVLDKYIPTHYPYFNNLFLVTYADLTIYDYQQSDLTYDVSDRKYVSEMNAGRCMSTNGVHSPFYLDAIISWSEQQFRGVIAIQLSDSIRNNTAFKEAVLTARLRTFSNPLLPPGTGFCIFDKSGNVLFHSDSVLALNENILEECGDCPGLRASVTGRTRSYMDVELSGTRCMMDVRPLDKLPYFIATFSQTAPVDAIHGQVFGMSFILQILLFVLYISIILFGLILLRRRTRLRIPLYSLASFIPDQNGSRRYLGAFLFNVLHGLLLISTVILVRDSFTVIALFFLSAPYTVLLNMCWLSGESLKQFITGKRVLLLRIYAVAIAVANVAAAAFTQWWWIIVIAQVLTIIVFLVMEKIADFRNSSGWFSTWAPRINYRQSYSALVFILAVMTCAIPAISFSILAYNKEKEIQVKTLQLNLMNQLVTRGETSGDSLFIRTPYYRNFYHTIDTNTVSDISVPGKSERVYDGMSAVIRNMVQNSGEKYNRMKYAAHDSLWTWNYAGHDLVMSMNTSGNCSPGGTHHLISAVPFFELPFAITSDTTRVIRFWSALSLAVIVLYFVLKNILGKIFVHEKYSRVRSLRFDQAFFESTEPGYKAFVTGMPSAGKTNYFHHISSRNEKLFTIDFVAQKKEQWVITLADALKPGKGIVLLDHFEHDILDKVTTAAKLDIVEQLLSNKEKKVIIISAVQSVIFLNMLETEEEKPEKKEEYAKFSERWNRALASFYDFTYPLQGYDRRQNPIITTFSARLQGNSPEVPNELLHLIESECDHGVFLQSIGVELLAELHGRPEVHAHMNALDSVKEQEDIIIRTQKLADNYYRTLWNNLAIEEQFVLYDLAQDGLVNSKNLDILESLIDKGLVIYRKQLGVMNRSFRNYVLCVAGPSDMGKIEQQMKDAGAWNKLKAPLFLIVCSLLLFVVKSDRTALFGYFTVFAAIIPIVTTFFGYFGKATKGD